MGFLGATSRTWWIRTPASLGLPAFSSRRLPSSPSARARRCVCVLVCYVLVCGGRGEWGVGGGKEREGATHNPCPPLTVKETKHKPQSPPPKKNQNKRKRA